jgi:peptidyl-prolyl cis-trans isomerase B (cyclophilin B)
MTFSTLMIAGAFLSADPPDFAKDTRPSTREAGGTHLSGKPITEYRDKVKELWPTILFEKDGKPIEYVAKIETDQGDMTLEFMPKVAPTHVRNFIALAKAGYYDGLKFHRCIKGFMIQGGCPLGNGMGGPGYALPAEFNKTPHVRGIVSAARTNDPNTAGSQFFLCHDTADFLDNKYTVYGKVTKGLEVIDKIVDLEPGREIPRKPATIKKVTISVKGAAAEKKEEKKD